MRATVTILDRVRHEVEALQLQHVQVIWDLLGKLFLSPLAAAGDGAAGASTGAKAAEEEGVAARPARPPPGLPTRRPARSCGG